MEIYSDKKTKNLNVKTAGRVNEMEREMVLKAWLAGHSIETVRAG